MRIMTIHNTGHSALDLEVSENIGGPNGPSPLLELKQGGIGITLSKADVKHVRKILDQFMSGDL